MAGRSFIAAILGAGSVLTLSLGGGYLISDTLNNAGDRISHPLKNIQVAKEYIPPEIFTGRAPKPVTTSDQYMIVSAHPAASYAGAEILKNGGNAIDAAFAAQMVLNLVEPQSSGIGGGGFMLYYDVKTRDVTAFDGRETAPLGVDLRFFYYPDGSPKKFMEAVIGGASVGVPGLLRMFKLAREEMLEKRGITPSPLTDIFAQSRELAESGFPVSPRLSQMLKNDKYFTAGMAGHDYFYGEDSLPPEAGDILKNPDFVSTLDVIAEGGIESFYKGEIAKMISTAVQTAPGNPGSMTPLDLANYKAKIRNSTCLTYRELHKICGMPPPSSGGIAVGQIMGLLNATNIDQQPPISVASIQLFAEAMKLAFADRGLYVADSDFVKVPTDGLLASDYLRSRAALMDISSQKKEKASPGNPNFNQASLSPDNAIELPSTTHLVVIDRYGNAVSLTSSIETAFGSHQMVGGFLLNNQLTDFARDAAKDGVSIANRIEPNKRPRSSMAPTIVLDQNDNIHILTGSPGGSRIIGFTAQSLVAMLDWGLTAQEAADLPRFLHRNSKLELEEKGFTPELIQALEGQGYEIRESKMTSGVHIIERFGGRNFRSGTDPRREGFAFGHDNMPNTIYESFSLIK